MKHITCCLLCLGICLYTTAQSHKITVGIQGGVNLNSTYKNHVSGEDKSWYKGVSVGGMIKIPVSKLVSIKLMPSYDVYGWAYKNAVFETDMLYDAHSAISYKLDYFNLPILAERSFGKKIKFAVSAGVFAGLLLDNEIIFTSGQQGVVNNISVYKTKSDNRKRFNAGIVVGAGVQFPLTAKINLNIDLRNSTGLTNIYKNTSTYNNSIKTITYTALAGVSYNL